MTGREAESLLSLVGLAKRAGVLQIGQDKIKSILPQGESLLILFAEGAESSFYRSIVKGRYAEKCTIRVLGGISGSDLSAAVGSGNVKVVALPLRSGFAASVSKLLAEGGIQFE